MQALNYATPGLLFPAISLLMIAYANRFIGLAGLVRDLIARRGIADPSVRAQVENLRMRLALLRHAQGVGGMSLVACTLSLLALFLDNVNAASLLFGLALVVMVGSLLLGLLETWLSTKALNIELDRILGCQGSRH